MDDSEQPNHEMDILSGHENDVNYVQFRLVSMIRHEIIMKYYVFPHGLPYFAVAARWRLDFS